MSAIGPQIPDTGIRALRATDAEIDEYLLARWSPRAMSGEPLADTMLWQLFEAARWAPSSINSQPWRFVYALRDTPAWEPMFDLLTDRNQRWVKHAAVLVAVLSVETDAASGRALRTHSFDAGAAWENIALQGSSLGLVVHGMSGLDYDRARTALNVPAGVTVEMMFAAGHPGKVADLPEDLQPKETPNGRRPVRELVSEGTYVPADTPK